VATVTIFVTLGFGLLRAATPTTLPAWVVTRDLIVIGPEQVSPGCPPSHAIDSVAVAPAVEADLSVAASGGGGAGVENVPSEVVVVPSPLTATIWK
jgi:hypothetical protein